MNENEEKRIRVNVTVSGAWPYSGGLWIGNLRKHGTNGSQMWESATLYGYWKETPVLFFTHNGSTNTWEVTEIVKSSDLGGSFRVGDVRQALPNMSAPNADWHACDGTQFNPNVYPILAPMCAQEMTKFKMVANSSLKTIIANLKPSYVATSDWSSNILYVEQLQKYYAYTWSTNSSSYGTNNALASEIDKCVIFDIQTNTYTVHNAVYPSTSYYYIENPKTAKKLYYNIKDKCFYCGFYSSLYSDSDDNVRYLEFMLYKSTDGYTWGAPQTVRNSQIPRWWSSKYDRLWFTLCNGKFHAILSIGHEYDSSTSSYYNQIYFYNFDTFAYSTIGSFTLATANYTTQNIDYSNPVSIYPVYDPANQTEEFFFKQYYTYSSGNRESIQYMYRYSTSNQYSSIPVPFINSYHSAERQYTVEIMPYKILGNYVVRGYQGASTSVTTYFGLSAESNMKNGTFTSIDALTVGNSGPYYDPVMNLIYTIKDRTIQWISASNWHAAATGTFSDDSSASFGPAIKTASGVTRFYGTAGLYERAFNMLYCRKYPTISVTGLKTFVRQQIS